MIHLFHAHTKQQRKKNRKKITNFIYPSAEKGFVVGAFHTYIYVQKNMK